MSKKRIQWHPAFCSSLMLELINNKDDLTFEKEHKINTGTISVDLLVIEKSSNVIIENEIGAIFREHNLFEYKSPDDSLNIDVFFKVIGYACLYKAKCPATDSIKAEDITITFVRRGKPIKLFKQLVKMGFAIENKYPGIYYLRDTKAFGIQILITGEMDSNLHIWLTSLTNTLSQQSAEKLIEETKSLTRKDDKENADSVMEVAMNTNKALFEEIKEDNPDMCEALRELFKPELEAAIKEKDIEYAEKLAIKDEEIAVKAEELAAKDKIIEELQKQLSLANS